MQCDRVEVDQHCGLYNSILFRLGFSVICVTVLRVRRLVKAEPDGSTLIVPYRLLGFDFAKRCHLVVRSSTKSYLHHAAPMP